MKKLLYIIPFLLLACNTTTKAPSINPDNIIAIKMDVEGMTCSGCENTIQETLLNLSGVDSVLANHIDSTAVVYFDSALISVNDLFSEFEKLPYTVEKYEKMDIIK